MIEHIENIIFIVALKLIALALYIYTRFTIDDTRG